MYNVDDAIKGMERKSQEQKHKNTDVLNQKTLGNTDRKSMMLNPATYYSMCIEI